MCIGEVGELCRENSGKIEGKEKNTIIPCIFVVKNDMD